jgi:hypothetical protein
MSIYLRRRRALGFMRPRELFHTFRVGRAQAAAAAAAATAAAAAARERCELSRGRCPRRRPRVCVVRGVFREERQPVPHCGNEAAARLLDNQQKRRPVVERVVERERERKIERVGERRNYITREK